MIDAKKYPKAAALQKQREEQYEAEQARQKADELKKRQEKAKAKKK